VMILALMLALLAVSTPTVACAQTRLFFADFESGTLASLFTLNVSAANSISTTQSHSPTHSVLYNPSGRDTSGALATYVSATDRFYFSFWWFLSPNFTNQTAGGQHGFRFGVPTGPGDEFGVLQLDTVIQAGATGPAFSIDILGTSGAEAGLDSLSRYHNLFDIPRGRWFRFEMLVVMNNPGGVNNGTLTVWLDGVRVFNSTTVLYRESTSSLWQTLVLNSNYDTATAGDYWYQDDVQVWTGCPTTGASCSSSGATLTGAPPTAPAISNLH
jgi:hypothetical protein